jgi:Ca2+-binding RTX toxin-like protein
MHPRRLVVAIAFLSALAGAPAAGAAGISASFSGSTLSISGDAGGRAVRIVRDAAGMIHVFLGPNEVTVSGGPATVNSTDVVEEAIQPADDFTIDMTGGPFAPGATHLVFFQGSNFIDRLAIIGNDDPEIIGTTRHGITLTGSGDDPEEFIPFTSLLLDGRGGDDRLLASTQTAPSACTVTSANVTVLGGAGNDHISGTFDFGNGATSHLNGGPGDDDIVATECAGQEASAARTVIVGGSGADRAIGSNRTDLGDLIKGGMGTDTIVGNAGPDVLFGGGGADSIVGIDGTPGNDTLNGQSGHDSCNGDPGDAIIKCES